MRQSFQQPLKLDIKRKQEEEDDEDGIVEMGDTARYEGGEAEDNDENVRMAILDNTAVFEDAVEELKEDMVLAKALVAQTIRSLDRFIALFEECLVGLEPTPATQIFIMAYQNGIRGLTQYKECLQAAEEHLSDPFYVLVLTDLKRITELLKVA